ncbi:MAG: hypothetical protein KDD91_21640, partial [Caldilinea sp.]|nr:hypothetical protein [Caldilinea sp.]
MPHRPCRRRTLAGPALLALSIWLAVASAAFAQPADPYSLWLPVIAGGVAQGANPTHQGIATYYDATGAGACSFDASPDDLMVSAMNADEYDNAALCGAFVRVTGPRGDVTVRIVDLCPECKAGHLDLSQEA